MSEAFLHFSALFGLDPAAATEPFQRDLKLALTHRSAVPDKHKGHNERLEFLGDAVLELLVTEWLYAAYPESPEGEMTSYRSALVRKEHLAAVARRMSLGDYLKMSKGEARSGGAEKDYLLANVFEALIGALYLHYGVVFTRTIVEQWVVADLDDLLAQGSHVEAKSAFQELSQARVSITPKYRVIGSEGPDHDKIFTVEALLAKTVVGTGTGGSKKDAETAAAADALTRQEEWVRGA